MIKIGNVSIAEFPLILAPMEDVSDPPFRILCRELGADLVFTEFISSEGLIRNADKSVQKLDIYPEERPVGIQIFGGEIESMLECARIVESVNPNILDINYGCPVSKVVCKGGGAGILKDVDKMERMTREIVKSTHLPVTVKTRLGWDDDSIRIVEVALRLQDAGIKALSIHARTRYQMYKGESDWAWIQKVKSHPDIEIPVFGNGDVDTPEKAHFNRINFGADGIMIGRAAIGYPWIFREIKHYFQTGNHLPPPTLMERLAISKRHLMMEVEWKGEKPAIKEMRRHYSNYFKNLPDFKPIRMKLVTSDTLSGMLEAFDEIEENYQAILQV